MYQQPAVKDGMKYYGYICVYVDNVLVLSKDTKQWIKQLGKIYEIKEGSAGPPDAYLGAQVGRQQLPDGREAWYISADKYVKNAVNIVQDLLDLDGNGLKINGAKKPFHSRYKPELDVTEKVDDGRSRY